MIRTEAAIAALCLGVVIGFVCGATLQRTAHVEQPCAPEMRAPAGFEWRAGDQTFRVLFEAGGFRAVHDPGMAARLAGVE
jgi:hypothetical protein